MGWRRTVAGTAVTAVALVIALLVVGSAGAQGGNVQAVQGSQFSGPVVTVPREPVSATIDWGDGATSPGTITQQGGSSPEWVISGSHTYHSHGSFSVTVTTTQAGGGTGTHPATATVAPAALTLSPVALGATAGNAGPRLVGHLADADAGHAPDYYSVTIDWGDGASSPATLTAKDAGFELTGGHAYAAPGKYTLALTATTADGRTATASAELQVVAAPGTTALKPPRIGRVTIPGGVRKGGKRTTFKQPVTPAAGRKVVLRLWSFGGAGAEKGARVGKAGARFTGGHPSFGPAVKAEVKEAPQSVNTIVTDDLGAQAYSAQSIQIPPPEKKHHDPRPCAKKPNGFSTPIADVVAEKVAEAPPTMTFDASQTLPGFLGCDPPGNLNSKKKKLTYKWEFDDGTESNEVSFTRSFPDDGKTRTVVFTVHDPKFGDDEVQIKFKASSLFCEKIKLPGGFFAQGPNCWKTIDLGGHPGYIAPPGAIELNGLYLTSSDPKQSILVVPKTGAVSLWPLDEKWMGKIDKGSATLAAIFGLHLELRRLDDFLNPFAFAAAGLKVPGNGILKVVSNPEYFQNGQPQAGAPNVKLNTNGTATVGLKFKPPAGFDPVSPNEPFPDTSKFAEGVAFDVPDLWFGPFKATGLKFVKQPGGGLSGEGEIEILELAVHVQFVFDGDGNLVSADAAMPPENPSIPLFNGPGLISLAAGLNADPFVVYGAGAFDSNPFTTPVIGGALYNINACFNVASADQGQVIPHWCDANGQPNGQFQEPAGLTRVHATGNMKAFSNLIDLAHASFDADEQNVALHGDFAYGLDYPLGVDLAHASGAIDAHASFADGRFEASGGVEVCAFSLCKGGSALLSRRGIAGCVPVQVGFDTPFFGFVGTTIDMGAWVRWDFSDGGLVFEGCDIHDKAHVAEFKGLPRWDEALGSPGVTTPVFAAGAAKPTFKVKSDKVALQLIAVRGSAGESPDVVVRGPKGRTFKDPGVTKTTGKGAVFLHNDTFETPAGEVVDGDATTYVVLGHPRKGSWSVEGANGSPPIGSVETATAPIPLQLDGQVTGKGDERKLKYAAAAGAAGEKVSFLEEGTSVSQKIGHGKTPAGGASAAGTAFTKKVEGTISFTPAPGPAGSRRVVAFITDKNGMPRRRVVLDKFKADLPELPKKPAVSAKATRDNLKVTWEKVPGAQQYIVEIDLGDGRTATSTLGGDKRSLLLPAPLPGAKAKAVVVAVDARGVKSKGGPAKATGAEQVAGIAF